MLTTSTFALPPQVSSVLMPGYLSESVKASLPYLDSASLFTFVLTFESSIHPAGPPSSCLCLVLYR